VQWSADRRHLLSAAHDRTVRVWDAETGDCLREFEGHRAGVVAARFSQDERAVISCDWNGGIRRWDITS
jgi:WD40 repeat protein